MRRLSSWEKKTLKSCVQTLPYQFTEEGIRLKGEAFFVEHELDQLRLMRLADVRRTEAALDYWDQPHTQDVHERLRRVIADHLKLAAQYEDSRAYVLEHGIPEDIRTSWTPRLPDWPVSVMWG